LADRARICDVSGRALSAVAFLPDESTALKVLVLALIVAAILYTRIGPRGR
jgi:hypothetical protein